MLNALFTLTIPWDPKNKLANSKCIPIELAITALPLIILKFVTFNWVLFPKFRVDTPDINKDSKTEDCLNSPTEFDKRREAAEEKGCINVRVPPVIKIEEVALYGILKVVLPAVFDSLVLLRVQLRVGRFLVEKFHL